MYVIFETSVDCENVNTVILNKIQTIIVNIKTPNVLRLYTGSMHSQVKFIFC